MLGQWKLCNPFDCDLILMTRMKLSFSVGRAHVWTCACLCSAVFQQQPVSSRQQKPRTPLPGLQRIYASRSRHTCIILQAGSIQSASKEGSDHPLQQHLNTHVQKFVCHHWVARLADAQHARLPVVFWQHLGTGVIRAMSRHTSNGNKLGCSLTICRTAAPALAGAARAAAGAL